MLSFIQKNENETRKHKLLHSVVIHNKWFKINSMQVFHNDSEVD